MLQNASDEADVPVERVPDRDRLQQGVDLAHRHREHRVGRDDDEQKQPETPGQGEWAPEAASHLGHVDFTSDHAVSQSPQRFGAERSLDEAVLELLLAEDRRVEVGGTSSSSTICSGVIPVNGCW